jgi:HEAT repeat protein
LKRTPMLLCAAICAASLFASLALRAAQEPADELVAFVVQLLNDKDKDMRALGLEQVRTEAPGQEATRQFAALLPQLPPEVQAALISALAARGDAVARSAIVDLLTASGNEPVRLAAIDALGYLGEPSDAQRLLLLLSKGSLAEQAAARTSLGRLPGQAVSRTIADELKRSPPPLKVTLFEILTTRRASDTAADILPQAIDADPSVRSAAMAALGQLAEPEHVAGMVQGILAAERGRERDAAERAVMLVCTRIEDAGQQARPLLAAMNALDAADRTVLLPALGRVGGPDALQVVKSALASRDSRLREAGVRALCNWPNASVASELTALTQTAEHPAHRTAALRALIRVAPLPDGRTDGEKLELLKKAIALCTADDERMLALQRAPAIRIPETLRFLIPYLDQPAYAQQACQSVVELAHHRTLRDANKAEFDQALDKVIQTSQDATVIDRAQRYKKGQTWAASTAP